MAHIELRLHCWQKRLSPKLWTPCEKQSSTWIMKQLWTPSFVQRAKQGCSTLHSHLKASSCFFQRFSQHPEANKRHQVGCMWSSCTWVCVVALQGCKLPSYKSAPTHPFLSSIRAVFDQQTFLSHHCAIEIGTAILDFRNSIKQNLPFRLKKLHVWNVSGWLPTDFTNDIKLRHIRRLIRRGSVMLMAAWIAPMLISSYPRNPSCTLTRYYNRSRRRVRRRSYPSPPDP